MGTLKVKFFNLFRGVFKFPPLERRLAQWTRGKLPNHFVCKLVPNPYQYRKPTLRQVFVDGIRMRLDISDYLGHYYFFGFHDQAQQNLFAMCKEHFVILDVGANIGFTVLKLAQRAPLGKVTGFEPDPVNFDHCSHNLSLNGFSNARVLNLGLGASDRELNLEVTSEGNRGGNRINQQQRGAKVVMKQLDHICSELELNKLDLIKLDVEGYELQVLKGGQRTLKKYKPILFIEVDNTNLKTYGDSAELLIQYVKSLGYDSVVNASDLQPLNDNFNFEHCHLDVIAR